MARAPSGARLALAFLLAPPILAALAALPAGSQGDFDSRVASLVRDLEVLRSSGFEVGPMVEELDSIIDLYESGRVEEALSRLEDLESRVAYLMEEAPRRRLVAMAGKYGLAGALLLIPVASYIALSRLYYLAWFRLRRRWLVRRVRA